MSWSKFLETEYWGNAMATWGLAAIALFGTWIGLVIARGFMARRLVKLSQTSERLKFFSLIGNMVGNTNGLLLMLMGLLGASKVLNINDRAAHTIDSIVIVGLLIQVGLWANTIIDYWTRQYRRQYLEKDPSRATIVHSMGALSKIVITVIVVLAAIENMGVQVTGLIASVGVVGIGVGFALQNVLGDIFASLSIVLDRPFLLGDFIIVGDKMGVVQNIGLKTTRLKSLWGEEIIMGNDDLLKSQIKNYKKMQERRIVFTFEVIYRTTREQLQSIPPLVRSIIEGTDPTNFESWQKLQKLQGTEPLARVMTRYDRAHFACFNDSGLKFEVVYYVASGDYNLYMDIQQNVLLEIFRHFQETGIEFAYPTQTTYNFNAPGNLMDDAQK